MSTVRASPTHGLLLLATLLLFAFANLYNPLINEDGVLYSSAGRTDWQRRAGCSLHTVRQAALFGTDSDRALPARIAAAPERAADRCRACLPAGCGFCGVLPAAVSRPQRVAMGRAAAPRASATQQLFRIRDPRPRLLGAAAVLVLPAAARYRHAARGISARLGTVHPACRRVQTRGAAVRDVAAGTARGAQRRHLRHPWPACSRHRRGGGRRDGAADPDRRCQSATSARNRA